MPTYEYQCKSCQHLFEAFQSMKDEPLKECPQCGQAVKRLIGGGLGVIFKGSGFYTTDYKKSSTVTGSVKNNNTDNNQEKKSTENSESKSEANNGSKSEAKSEVKSESKNEVKKEAVKA